MILSKFSVFFKKYSKNSQDTIKGVMLEVTVQPKDRG